jgi:Na+/melibiose symporter-like transporter
MGLLMFGVFFALPLYFQAVQGNSTLGTGLRLLPLIAGLLVGTRVVGPLDKRLSDSMTISIGFGVAALGLAAGTFSAVDSPFALTAGWLVVVGAGIGRVLPTAMNAALKALPPTLVGSGSALIQALRQAGGTIGVALLGTLLNAGYRGAVPRVPDPAVQARIDESVSAGVAVAHAIGRPDLLAAVQSAFVHGMSSMLLVCAALAGALALFSALALWRPSTRHHDARRRQSQSIDEQESEYVGE